MLWIILVEHFSCKIWLIIQFGTVIGLSFLSWVKIIHLIQVIKFIIIK